MAIPQNRWAKWNRAEDAAAEPQMPDPMEGKQQFDDVRAKLEEKAATLGVDLAEPRRLLDEPEL
eukprot:2178475-Lingulodinium_polyedra.AAC.1